MQNLSRRDFIAAAGALGGAVLLGGCGDSETSSSPAATPKPQAAIGDEPGKLSILEWGGYEAGGHKAQKSGLFAGTPYTKEFGADGLSYTYIVNDNQSLQKAATSGPFDIMHPCIQMVPSFVEQELVQPWDPELLAELRQPRPVPAREGAGRRQAVHDPLGLGLRQPALPHRHGRRGGRDQLGPGLEREVQGQDLALERQLVELRDDGAQARHPEDRRHDAGGDPALQGGADQAEAAEQVPLVQRVRPDASGLQERRHPHHVLVAGGLRDHEGGRAEGEVHGARGGSAGVGVRLHARRRHGELPPRAQATWSRSSTTRRTCRW